MVPPSLLPSPNLPSQLRRLVNLSVQALSLVETCRSAQPKLGELASTLISTLSTVLPHVLCSIAVDEGAMQVDGEEEQVPMAVASALPSVILCLDRAVRTLRNLRDGEPNHFGICRAILYVGELSMLGDKIQRLMDGCGGTGGAAAESRLLSSVDSDIRCISARLWWAHHIGAEVGAVRWYKFSESFFAEFGQNHPEAMSKLRKLLCGEDLEGDFSHDECTVTVRKYDQVTFRHGGLYEAFQFVADPDRLVFVMGVIDDDPHTVALEPIVVEPLLGVCITQVCCGGQHAACLSEDGKIYTWGRGGFGRLGHGNSAHVAKPKLVESLEDTPCSQIACGFAYTAAVTRDGCLYTWGAGENGRLGLGDVEDRDSPVRVEGLKDKPVAQVFAGSVHTCILAEDGGVYSFGKHEYTGHGAESDVLLPRKIQAFEGMCVSQISVGPGGYHTISLTKGGDVYTWGHNRVGQLGYCNSDVVPRNVHGAYFLPEPQLVSTLAGRGISQVVAGWGHSAALSSSGVVYICGRNVQGQLGLGNPADFPQNERGHPYQAGFQPITELSHVKVTQIACGGEHSVAIAATGEVFTFGAGHRGQLGHGTDVNQHFPKRVAALTETKRQMLQVSCGNNCTLILAGKSEVPSLYNSCLKVIQLDPNLHAQFNCVASHANIPQHGISEFGGGS
jgi:alpha-tubulin suppressor-like RCC1 family protein